MIFAGFASLSAVGLAGFASAQSDIARNDSAVAAVSDSNVLPDAPGAVSSDDQAGQKAPAGQVPVKKHRTGPYDELIDPTEIAPRLTATNKVVMGLRDAVSPFAVLGWVGSALYGEAFNGSPNYGQNPKNFLQRFGAASARSSSETIFTVSVIAPILHEDPRYYVLGPGHNGIKRTTHALGQIFFTRMDSGKTSVNYSLLGGNLAGAALTQAYYPPVNRGAGEVFATYGTSLGGSAIKYLFDEFFADTAAVIQLKHKLPL